MIPQSLTTLTEWTGGRLLAGDPHAVVGSVCTDTRNILPGCLFVALAGERFDACEFAAQAIASGAAAVMVSRAVVVPDGAGVVLVDDTLAGLQALAAAYRRVWGGQVIGLTGSNGKTSTLEKDKIAARDALRLADVFTFANAISYDKELGRIAALKTVAETAATAHTDAEKEIREAEAEVQTWRAKQKDERKGAERVNSLLTNFFGHDGIKLAARDGEDKVIVKFEVTRDGKAAYNLSEGECSLIAFCYFMAKLDDPESKGKDLIIYIDDPISSLDGNHIFFMFSLIESLIAKPIKKDGANSYRYKQLFISTHNLDFLKYLKQLSIPSKKIPVAEGKTRNVSDHEHFMIERNGAS